MPSPAPLASSTAFNHAQNTAQADQERLQSRAIELQRLMTTPGLSRTQMQAFADELQNVTTRLQMTQHMLDNWAEQLTEAARARAVDAAGDFDVAPPPVRSAPMLQALVARNESLPERTMSLPLGQQLLADFRRNVRPALEEQLDGLDSPFQPPSVISVALERTLRQHMFRLKQEWEEAAATGDDSRQSMAHEFGRALVELLRALANEQKLNAPRGGIEAIRERVRLIASPPSPAQPASAAPTLGAPRRLQPPGPQCMALSRLVCARAPRPLPRVHPLPL